MLTPRFELSQTDEEVLITIHAPYANIKDTEVYVEGSDFRFFSTPYYLRLQLPGEIIENDASSGSYDCEKGDFFLKFSKVNPGEHFENLDMITCLLAPPKKRNKIVPTIEVISNPAANDEETATVESDNKDSDDEEKDNEWFIDQNVNASTELLTSTKYGFASKVSGALTAFEDGWLKEIIDLPNPDSTEQSERKTLREKHELESFSEEHYMADLMQKDCVEPYLNFVPEWDTLETETAIVLSDEEKDLLKELPNKEYLLDDKEIESLLYGLVDILYGSCYNYRTTLGENTVESGWTVNKLSSTLCWFQDFKSMDDVVHACIRRSLCYPLVRNWNLALKVLEDTKKIVKLGKRYIVKRFCEIHKLFDNSYEPRYLLNQLYIKDYLIWLQQVPASTLESILPLLDEVTPSKDKMNLELDVIEEAAYSVEEEDLVIGNAVDQATVMLDNIFVSKPKKTIINLPCDDSSDSSDTDSDDTSSSDDSSSSSFSSSTYED